MTESSRKLCVVPAITDEIRDVGRGLRDVSTVKRYDGLVIEDVIASVKKTLGADAFENMTEYKCDICDCRVWAFPHMIKAMESLAAAGELSKVLCLTCTKEMSHLTAEAGMDSYTQVIGEDGTLKETKQITRNGGKSLNLKDVTEKLSSKIAADAGKRDNDAVYNKEMHALQDKVFSAFGCTVKMGRDKNKKSIPGKATLDIVPVQFDIPAHVAADADLLSTAMHALALQCMQHGFKQAELGYSHAMQSLALDYLSGHVDKTGTEGLGAVAERFVKRWKEIDDVTKETP